MLITLIEHWNTEKNGKIITLFQKRAKGAVEKPRKDIEMDVLLEILKGKRFITCHSYVQSEINMLMKVAENFGIRINTFTIFWKDTN